VDEDTRAAARYFFFPPLLRPPELFFRPPDVFRPPEVFLAARLRLAADRRLFTVAAAIRFAVLALRPRPAADFLIFSYILLFLAPFTPRGGIKVLLAWQVSNVRAVCARATIERPLTR